MVSAAKAWSRRPLASGLELGASGSAVQPLGLGTQGQGLPELEEVLTFSPFLSFLFFFFFFWWDWSLNSGLQACKTGVLPFDPHLQSKIYLFI
jgi:hypothetical protein